MRLSTTPRAAATLPLVTALLGGCADAPVRPSDGAPPTYTISGAVTEGAGAVVRATGPVERFGAVDAAGRFSIGGLPPGTYTVAPVLPGWVFLPYEDSVRLEGGDRRAVTFRRALPEEGVPEEILLHIDTIPTTSLTEDEIILPNGMTMAAFRRDMEARGIRLDEPLMWTESVEPGTNAGAPAPPAVAARPLPHRELPADSLFASRGARVP